jgi:protein-disulfide isomerase
MFQDKQNTLRPWWIILTGITLLAAGCRTAATPTPTRSVPAVSPAYKQFGSPSAPVTLEVYTDYECPACARLYKDTIPMLMADYVITGKIRMVHRDYPLAMHPYSKIAARYANAAGTVGQYGVAVDRLFTTQAQWARDGDVETQLSQVLPPDAMQKVRGLVTGDPHLDDTVVADVAMGNQDHLSETPTLVVVHDGKREIIKGAPDYGLLKSYLDRLLAQ